MIEIAEQNRDEEIEKVEAGIESVFEEQEEPEVSGDVSEWHKIQQMSNEDYLMRTVLPVLYQGMKLVDQQRPVVPLEYLALYLLKHQD